MPKSNLIRPKGEDDNVRFKHKDVKCRCGNHNRDKRRILWKQGRHKTNKAINYEG